MNVRVKFLVLALVVFAAILYGCQKIKKSSCEDISGQINEWNTLRFDVTHNVDRMYALCHELKSAEGNTCSGSSTIFISGLPLYCADILSVEKNKSHKVPIPAPIPAPEPVPVPAPAAPAPLPAPIPPSRPPHISSSTRHHEIDDDLSVKDMSERIFNINVLNHKILNRIREIRMSSETKLLVNGKIYYAHQIADKVQQNNLLACMMKKTASVEFTPQDKEFFNSKIKHLAEREQNSVFLHLIDDVELAVIFCAGTSKEITLGDVRNAFHGVLEIK